MVEKAQALSLLDIGVVKVYRDGSSREYIHQAFKLLSEEAKDQIAKVRTAGEILKLRTITAEGESLEPVAALSGGNYVMPGMLNLHLPLRGEDLPLEACRRTLRHADLPSPIPG